MPYAQRLYPMASAQQLMRWGGRVEVMAWTLPRTFKKAMKIDQKNVSLFNQILPAKAAPRVLFGSPWFLASKLRKRLSSRHSLLNLKYISVMANYTFAFAQTIICVLLCFVHMQPCPKGLPACKQKLSQNETMFVLKVFLNL